MKAVVIGGNGFIGGHLVERLASDGWAVTVYDMAPARFATPRKDVTYAMASLGDEGMLAEVLPGADVVFHLASTTIPQSSNDSPDFDVRSNLIDTIHLLERCVEHRVGRVVFLSSGGTVYGNPQRLPVNEDHPTDPICSYGIVKLAIEKYLHLYHELHGLAYTVLRPANPYGPRQNPTARQGAIAVFLGHVAKGEPIQIWGDGSIVRDFFYIDDLVDACIAAAKSDRKAGVYNVGAGMGESLNEIVAAIKDVVDRPVRVERLPGRDFDVPKVYLGIDRATRELGWSPRVDLREGLAKTWAWVAEGAWMKGGPR